MDHWEGRSASAAASQLVHTGGTLGDTGKTVNVEKCWCKVCELEFQIHARDFPTFQTTWNSEWMLVPMDGKTILWSNQLGRDWPDKNARVRDTGRDWPTEVQEERVQAETGLQERKSSVVEAETGLKKRNKHLVGRPTI